VVRFALNRSVSAVLTLLGVLALVFGLVTAAPGDAAALAARAGGNRAVAVSPEALAAFRHLYGLDRPVVERFVTWVWRAARLDFGRSLVDGQPVTLRVARALPATFALNMAALLLACLIGVPLGIAAARRPGGRLDRISGLVCDAFFATPTFVLGLVLLLVFSGWLRITPLFADAESGVRAFLLPVATLSLASLALVARFVRVCVAAALADPAALAGRARGERPSEEIRRALRRSVAAFAAMGAVLVPSVVSGSILVERVFSLPGAGNLLAEAVFARDLPTVLALTWCSAVVVVAASLVADLVTAALDPRTARELEGTVPGVAA
jgi:peptide/nickel transport system permease protein